MRKHYSRKRRNQLELYFRCLSSVCTHSMLGYYYIPYEFHFTERFLRNSVMVLALKLWEIRDAASLKRKIRWLLDEGYRAEYKEMHQKLAVLTEASRRRYIETSREQPEYLEMSVVHKFLWSLPSGEIGGFGCGWAIFLSRIGVVYRYLTVDEAWEIKLEAARLVQRYYRSWDEYFMGYGVGSHQFKIFMELKRSPDGIDRSNVLMGLSSLAWKKAVWEQNLLPDKEQGVQRKQEELSV